MLGENGAGMARKGGRELRTRATKSFVGRANGQTDKPALSRKELIYCTLRDRICSVEYPPGSVLRETELAREFNISRTPIRHALTALEHDGLVVVKHGVGNIVSEIDPVELVDVFIVRMILWQSAGDFFSSPFPAGTAERFVGYKETFQSIAPGDVVGFGRANSAYYTGMCDLITNRCLRDTVLKLFFQTSRMWLVSLPSLDWDEVIDAVSNELDELARLIRLDDPIGLGLAARNHVFMARKRILDGLGLELTRVRNPL